MDNGKVNRNYDFAAGYDAEPSGDIKAVDSAIFGQLKDAGERVVVQSIPIANIYTDIKQPRRIIPAEARGRWMGEPDGTIGALIEWHRLSNQMVVEQKKNPIDIRGFIESLDDLPMEPGDYSGTAAAFVELLALAASIKRDGQTNPITVIRRAGGYTVETGERRLLAHHILNEVYQTHDKIKTILIQSADVWRQASENGSRQPLNAIGMARQLALLIMDMYKEQSAFEPFNKIVQPGGIDRVYYAQVARGDLYPIKRGFSKRVLQATGLKSRAQISQYRNLLTIDDGVWALADFEDWTEGKIRKETTVEVASKPKQSINLGAAGGVVEPATDPNDGIQPAFDKTMDDVPDEFLDADDRAEIAAAEALRESLTVGHSRESLLGELENVRWLLRHARNSKNEAAPINAHDASWLLSLTDAGIAPDVMTEFGMERMRGRVDDSFAAMIEWIESIAVDLRVFKNDILESAIRLHGEQNHHYQNQKGADDGD